MSKINGEGRYFCRRKIKELEKEKNIWRRQIFGSGGGENKNGKKTRLTYNCAHLRSTKESLNI